MKRLLIAILIGSAFVGCSSLKVYSDKDSSYDFATLKTLEYYGWAENSDKLLNDIDKQRIENAFAEEFKKRGISVVPKGQGGDMIVTLFIVTEAKTQTTANTTSMGGMYGGYGGYYGYGPGWGWGGGMSTTTYSEHDYTVGTLAVSCFDPKDQKLVWEGIGKGTINENPKNRDQRIKDAAAKIMSNYPVKPQ